MDNSTTKQCSTCKQFHPATTEYFHKSSKHRIGLLSDCKTCANAKGREKTRKHGVKPYQPTRRDGKKRCSRCKDWKPETVEFFNKDKNRVGGFARWCTDCCKQKWAENSHKYGLASAKWREENAEYLKAQQAEYRARPEIREKRRQQTEDWRKDNPDRHRENAIDWAHRNPIKVRVNNERRRTRKQGLPDELTVEQWQYALEYFNGCCAVCGRPNGLWHTLAVDHWIPLNTDNCPGTVASNCIPLCHGAEGCNNSKHDVMPDVWLNRKFGRQKANQILSRIDKYFQILTE